MREFSTGATRSSDAGKPDLEGFLSPLVIRRYGEFMHKNRVQADGKLRASDNWQKGMGRDVFLKSAHRHFLSLWLLHRGYEAKDEFNEPQNVQDELCACLFNLMGYLHETLLEELKHELRPKQVRPRPNA